MKFKKVVDPTSSEFKAIWSIYETTFPEDHKRDLELQKEYLGRKNYNFNAIYSGKEIIGLIAEWDFEDFFLVEHYAIRKGLRGKGFGTKILKEYHKSKDKLVIGEAERPNTREKARRLGFFKRIGIILNKYEFVQPAYSKDKKEFPLFLMSYPRAITEREFRRFRNTIHREVYGFEDPLLKL